MSDTGVGHGAVQNKTENLNPNYVDFQDTLHCFQCVYKSILKHNTKVYTIAIIKISKTGTKYIKFVTKEQQSFMNSYISLGKTDFIYCLTNCLTPRYVTLIHFLKN